MRDILIPTIAAITFLLAASLETDPAHATVVCYTDMAGNLHCDELDSTVNGDGGRKTIREMGGTAGILTCGPDAFGITSCH